MTGVDMMLTLAFNELIECVSKNYEFENIDEVHFKTP